MRAGKGRFSMDKFPLYLNGRSIGELTVTREGLYDCFRVECSPPDQEIYRAYAVGEQGRLRLGILEPEGEVFGIRRKIPVRETAEAGKLVCGQLQTLEEEPWSAVFTPEADWRAVPHPERLFRSSFLREQLRGISGVLIQEQAGCRFVALPYSGRRPFLLASLFCFARIQRISGREYAVFAFDRDENPVFR